jgi:hypothetical protein
MDKAKVDTFIAALKCTAQVTWTGDIQKLFTPLDIDHMKKQAQPIDLSSYEDVSKHAKVIYRAVSTGYMPRDEDRWTQAKCDTFGCWIQQGCKR